MTKNKISHSILLFFQGILVGTGAILPGISGGVLCVAFGIYEPMMDFLSHPIRTFRKNIRLLFPVILGGIVGFVLLAKVVESFLSAATVAAMLLFCGLICGTIPDLMRKSVAANKEKGWSFFIITLLASFVFFNVLDQGIQGNMQANFWWYIFCGAIWGLSMVVPGLSSSSILLFMGLYQPMAQGIGNLDFEVLIPLMIGFVVTIAITSKIMNYFLEKHYTILSKIILGFVISSVLMIVPLSYDNVTQLLIGIGCFALGFLVSIWMDSRKNKSGQ